MSTFENSAKSPCYMCNDRKGGCHAECEKYKHWQEEKKLKLPIEDQYWSYVGTRVFSRKGKK